MTVLSNPASPTFQLTAPAVQGSLASDTSRLGNRANLDAAGQQFEAIFTKMMLSSMRQAKLAEGLFDSQASDQFRDMQDQEMAENMAAHTPIGIGRAMTEFLARSGQVGPAPTQPQQGSSQ